MRNAWTIARREYHRFFTSPIAYVVAFVMLLTLGIMFAITIIYYRQNALGGGGYGAPPAPDIGGITGTFAFLLILMLPAITMRLIADENRMGTMELLLTAPVRDWELIVGKWLGGLLYMLTLIATTLVYAFILNALESPGIDQQQMMTSYLGLILVSASLLALGVGISAMFNNQIAAFFMTLGVFVFLWWLVGFPAKLRQQRFRAFQLPRYEDAFLRFDEHGCDQSLGSGLLPQPHGVGALCWLNGSRSPEVGIMAKKRNSSARVAVIGLIIAALGCLGTATFGIIRGSEALGLYTPARSREPHSRTCHQRWRPPDGSGAVRDSNPAAVRRFFAGRQARYGSNALVMSLAFIGILIVVNWLAFKNPKKFDLSEGKQHTLAPETLRALETLPGKVVAKAFYSSQYPSSTARSLLNDFKSSSEGKFDFEFVDPNADPVQARQYGITGDGKIVLTMGDAREIAAYADENTLTQAMIRLISPEARVLYFLTGHGEPDLQASDPSSMLRARQTLESKNYTVEELNLAATNSVPEDAKVVIIAGATDPLSESGGRAPKGLHQERRLPRIAG